MALTGAPPSAAGTQLEAYSTAPPAPYPGVLTDLTSSASAQTTNATTNGGMAATVAAPGVHPSLAGKLSAVPSTASPLQNAGAPIALIFLVWARIISAIISGGMEVIGAPALVTGNRWGVFSIVFRRSRVGVLIGWISLV
jgi:hypothetical protein